MSEYPIDAEQLARRPSTPEITWTRDLAVVDLETTGFDPKICAVTEIAVIRCDPHLRERERLHVKVLVPADAHVSPWVIENTAWGQAGPYVWFMDGARSLRTALSQAGRLLEGASIVAHCVPFESRWLSHLYQRAPEETPGRAWVLESVSRRRNICTRELASVLVARGRSESRSLVDVCAALGVPLKRHHDALCDASATLEVARRLLSGRV